MDTDTSAKRMSRDQIAAELAAAEQAHSQRVEVWIDLVEPNGTISGRLYGGSFNMPPQKPEERE